MSDPLSRKNSKGGLIRQLGLFDSTMMMVGIVIGSGIFLITGIMAKEIPSVSLILLAWIVGGVLILAGALTYAELGTAMPEAGGQYVYLREAYGPLFGFLFGWKMFLVNMTGAIAALGMAFAEYFGHFFPSLSTQNSVFSTSVNLFGKRLQYNLSAGQLTAILIILILSAFNYIGVKYGKTLQNVLTVVKIGTILAFVFFCVTTGKKIPIDFSSNPSGLGFWQLFFGFGIALVAVFWAFDGWNNINYVAEEIKNPKRNLTFALVFGTLLITFLYVLMNVAYFLALPVNEMQGMVRIAEKATTALHGPAAAGFISGLVLVSVLGALNGAIFAGPRVYYALARDRLFFKRVAKIHPRFQTPSFAILLQALWASILALTGSFEQLFTFAMFVGILFWIAAAASVFTLRKKFPDLPRPYKTWGYPLVPMVFIITLSGVLLSALLKRPVQSLTGLGITMIGIPVYYWWKKKIHMDNKQKI
jgi:APA family basic amino acid/polyamine antiporter